MPTDAAEESPSTSSESAGSAPSMAPVAGPAAGSSRLVRRRTPRPCHA